MKPDFLWGVATSSYQIEGAADKDGRGETIWDRFSHTPGKVADGSSGDVACDHYHRYVEDVQLIKSIGVSAYRFSIAWSRILPEGTGSVNATGLDFYDRLVDELLANNITPFVTLFHWDLPQALQDKGGWANRDTAHAFADYAAIVAGRVGDRVPMFATHNEPWCSVFLGHYLGMHAPGITDFKHALQASHHVLLSHGLAVPRIRDAAKNDVQVGAAPNIAVPHPASDTHADRDAAYRYDGYFNRWFLDPLDGKGYPQDIWDYYGDKVPQVEPGDVEAMGAPLDFLGVNYYNDQWIAADPDDENLGLRGVPNPSLPLTADREIAPNGMFLALTRLHKDYSFPTYYITENGAAFDDKLSTDGCVHDSYRSAFLASHFAQAARAIEASVPLEGYFVWSLMDNFEWSEGYNLRYGITYVDFDTQQRTLKDSAQFYRDFIRNSEH